MVMPNAFPYKLITGLNIILKIIKAISPLFNIYVVLIDTQICTAFKLLADVIPFVKNNSSILHILNVKKQAPKFDFSIYPTMEHYI